MVVRERWKFLQKFSGHTWINDSRLFIYLFTYTLGLKTNKLDLLSFKKQSQQQNFLISISIKFQFGWVNWSALLWDTNCVVQRFG